MSNVATTGDAQFEEVEPKDAVKKGKIYKTYNSLSIQKVRDTMRKVVMKNRKCTAKEYGLLKEVYYTEAQEIYRILNGETLR